MELDVDPYVADTQGWLLHHLGSYSKDSVYADWEQFLAQGAGHRIQLLDSFSLHGKIVLSFERQRVLALHIIELATVEDVTPHPWYMRRRIALLEAGISNRTRWKARGDDVGDSLERFSAELEALKQRLESGRQGPAVFREGDVQGHWWKPPRFDFGPLL